MWNTILCGCVCLCVGYNKSISLLMKIALENAFIFIHIVVTNYDFSCTYTFATNQHPKKEPNPYRERAIDSVTLDFREWNSLNDARCARKAAVQTIRLFNRWTTFAAFTVHSHGFWNLCETFFSIHECRICWMPYAEWQTIPDSNHCEHKREFAILITKHEHSNGF